MAQSGWWPFSSDQERYDDRGPQIIQHSSPMHDRARAHSGPLANEYYAALADDRSAGDTMPAASSASLSSQAIGHSELKEQMKRAHHMTKLMLQSAEENLNGKLVEVRSMTQSVLERLDKFEGGTLDAMRSQMEALRTEVEVLKSSHKSGNQSVFAPPRQAPNVDTAKIVFLSAEVDKIKNDVARHHHDLKEDVARNYQDLMAQMYNLRVLTEHSSIRAGFLAVAASECGQEEKAYLFNKLKEREDALHAIEDKPGSEMPLPIEHGNLTARGRAAQAAVEEFDIRISKGQFDTEAALGVVFNDPGGPYLAVKQVDAGLIRSWNNTNLGKDVRPNDLIVACNGKAGSYDKLLQEIKQARVLQLRVRRSGPGAVAGQHQLRS